MLRKTALFAGAAMAAVLINSAAGAADIAFKAAPVSEWQPIWAGAYVGVNAGAGWANVSATGGGPGSKLNGFVGGGQVGYNFQTPHGIVFGIEADLQGTSQKASDTVTILATPVTVDQKLPWFGTVRGRLGYAAGPALFYVTGGVGWAKYEMTVSALGASVSSSDTKSAWTLGGGVEWMFAPKWSTKLEYLYMDTGDTNVTLFGTTISARAKDNIVRTGLNYHF